MVCWSYRKSFAENKPTAIWSCAPGPPGLIRSAETARCRPHQKLWPAPQKYLLIHTPISFSLFLTADLTDSHRLRRAGWIRHLAGSSQPGSGQALVRLAGLFVLI